MIRIFDVEDGIVKPNENCILIPEFKAIMDKYTDPIPALAYIYYMCAPDSPYANLEEDEKGETISDDVGGDFSLEDDEIEKAMEKYKKLAWSRTQRLHRAAGINLDRMAKYLEETQISEGRDGSAEILYKWQVNLPKLVEGHKKLEKMVQEELKTRLRGSAQSGMYYE